MNIDEGIPRGFLLSVMNLTRFNSELITCLCVTLVRVKFVRTAYSVPVEVLNFRKFTHIVSSGTCMSIKKIGPYTLDDVFDNIITVKYP